MRIESTETKIWNCIQKTPETQLQNALMRMPDRICAVSLSKLTDEQKDYIFSTMSPIKARRIREEIGYQRRLNIPEANYLKIVRSFLSLLGSGEKGNNTDLNIYIRPRKR